MRVNVLGIDFQAVVAPGAQFIFRQHAVNGLTHQFSGVALALLRDRPLLQTAGIATVSIVDFLLFFAPTESDRLGVDNDHPVAVI